MPRRIAYQEHTHTFGVLTVKYQIDDNFEEIEVNYLKLFDDQTFEGEKYNFKAIKLYFKKINFCYCCPCPSSCSCIHCCV
jgi:hypothetical protein